uniref:Uncharacterized protein n=1 Tax=Brassica oleracea TaxID=3712 RepID=A0A3P6FB66_BRAOL|nr:unnamed protein product [Brassica oleracea]
MTFEAWLQARRGFFIAGPPVPNPWSNRHLTEVSFRKYQQLCLRGFLVQGMLVLDDPGFGEARSIVENVGWIECISNLLCFGCWFLQGMPFLISTRCD